MASQVPVSKLQPLRKRKLGTSSLHRHFGSTSPVNLPRTLGRPRLSLPDQEATDFCTAYGEAVSSGFKYNLPMSPEWQTGMESRYYGYPITSGADSAGSMDATILNSSLPQALCSVSLQKDGAAYVANWHNYDPSLQSKALPYSPGIPYKVDGPYDMFDNIRSALYQAWQSDKSVVKVFGEWYQSFNDSAKDPKYNGVVSLPKDLPITLHRYNFVDFDTILGKDVIVAALTQGPDFGDNGYLYFDRETIDFLFRDMSGLGLYISKPASFNWPTTIAYFRIILSHLLP